MGRQFSNAAVELALASYPGFHVTTPPKDGEPYGVFTPGYVPAEKVPHVAVLADGTRIDIAQAAQTQPLTEAPRRHCRNRYPPGRCVAPLGILAGARSGDKGGSANVGVWVRTDEEYRWLAHALTVETLRELLPETEHLEVARYLLPKLRAVNFVIQDILGKGVAYQARFDPQAKGIGEWLRSREIDIPESLLEGK